MTGKKTPNWVVKSVRQDGDINRWTDIGVGFNNPESESITLLLNALPLSDRVVLMKPRENNDEAIRPKVFNPLGQ
jgi:hypothetical protein